jgi:hypothetical protein
MGDLKQTLLSISEKILQKLLDYKKDHPEFTFALRERDSVQSDEERLSKGQWFQGSNYIYVPLFSRGDTLRKIKTLGFVLTLEEDGEISENYIEISFKGGITDAFELNFHRELADQINLNLNESNFGTRHYEDPEDYLNNLSHYLEEVYPVALTLLDKYNLRSKYVISQETFSKRIAKINDIKSRLNFVTPKVGAIALDFGLNQIFYGPPGTGKTHKLNQLKDELFTDAGVVKATEDVLREYLDDYPFWQVLAAALFASKVSLSVGELVQQPLVKARANLTIKTKPANVAWADLQSYADDESTQLAAKYRRSLKLFHKNAQGKWSIAADKREELPNIIDQSLLELGTNPNHYKSSQAATESRRYNFITFHQKYSYEDFIEGIRPVLRHGSKTEVAELEETAGGLNFELRKGIFYESCRKALQLAGYDSFGDCYRARKEERKSTFARIKGLKETQFALVIDEINRANISAVFGELITLIEKNKRIGEDEEMWVTLPYSNEPFAVPPNLYLIGSMNTADRSIALLDIALRRRFEFVALYPDYGFIPEWSDMLKAINQKIYEIKKNPDFFIGHAFFIDQDIEDKVGIFNTKIIPLLLEYFQNNLGIVRSILTDAEIKTEEPSIDNNFQLIAID